MRGGAQAETRLFGRSASLLAAGIGLAGVLTYLYFALASHQLEPTDYGEVVVLWSAMYVAVSVLYRPVEQLLSRTIAEREAHGRATGAALRIAAVIQASIAAAFAITALALRAPLQDDLLSGNAALYWILVAAIVAYAGAFFARGFLAGRRRFGVLAVLLLAEALARMLFALGVAVGVASGQTAVALGVAAGPCLSLLVVPLAFARRAAGDRHTDPPSSDDGAFTLGKGSHFAAAVFLVMLSEQIILSTGPLLVHASAGAAAAGFIFNVLMVARAPLLLFQGVAISLLPHLTRLRAGAWDGGEAFAHSIRVTMLGIAGFTVLTCLVVLAAGPELMQLAFGEKFTYDRTGLFLVALGIGPYLAATTLNQAALAKGQARLAAGCWGVCAIGFLAWNLTGVLDPSRRVEIGFLAAGIVLGTLLYVLYRRPHAPPDNVPAPASLAEVEARLVVEEVG